MSWTDRYNYESTKSAQKPVYCLVLFEDRTQLGADLSATPSTINGASGDAMTLRERHEPIPVMVYDRDGFEFYRGVYDSVTNDIAVEEYGAYGTTARTFVRSRSNIAVPMLCFTTHALSGEAGQLFETGMEMPSGSEQEMDLVEGYTRTNPVTVGVQDRNQRITKALAGRSLIGKWGMILGGYEGMLFREFVVLHAGPITRMTIRGGIVYDFEVDTVMVKLKRKLFGDIGDFSTTLSGNMNSSQTTLPLNDYSLVYDSAPSLLGEKPFEYTGLNIYAAEWTAAMHFKIGTSGEYVRHDSGDGPVNITRGALGSTAAAHTTGATVDMCFVIEGNPINQLLGLLLTRDPGYSPLALTIPGEASGRNYDWSVTVDDNMGPLGLHLEIGDIDITTFEEVRDQWFPRYYGRTSFSKATDMETAIREIYLKPLGINLYVSRAGKLCCCILRPPLQADPRVLDTSNVIGIPEIEFTNEEIVNEVTVEYDHDYITGEAENTVTVLDATSQSTYDRAGDCELTPGWMRSDLRGGTLAPRLARKKMRHHREPNPMIPLEVLYTQVAAEIGSIPKLTLPNMPDPVAGRKGWNKLAVITARRVNWREGTLTLDLLNTAYQGRRYFLISPSGTADFDAATEDETNVYGWVGPLSDGSQSYQIM